MKTFEVVCSRPWSSSNSGCSWPPGSHSQAVRSSSTIHVDHIAWVLSSQVRSDRRQKRRTPRLLSCLAGQVFAGLAPLPVSLVRKRFVGLSRASRRSYATSVSWISPTISSDGSLVDVAVGALPFVFEDRLCLPQVRSSGNPFESDVGCGSRRPASGDWMRIGSSAGWDRRLRLRRANVGAQSS